MDHVRIPFVVGLAVLLAAVPVGAQMGTSLSFTGTPATNGVVISDLLSVAMPSPALGIFRGRRF